MTIDASEVFRIMGDCELQVLNVSGRDGVLEVLFRTLEDDGTFIQTVLGRPEVRALAEHLLKLAGET